MSNQIIITEVASLKREMDINNKRQKELRERIIKLEKKLYENMKQNGTQKAGSYNLASLQKRFGVEKIPMNKENKNLLKQRRINVLSDKYNLGDISSSAYEEIMSINLRDVVVKNDDEEEEDTDSSSDEE